MQKQNSDPQTSCAPVKGLFTAGPMQRHVHHPTMSDYVETGVNRIGSCIFKIFCIFFFNVSYFWFQSSYSLCNSGVPSAWIASTAPPCEGQARIAVSSMPFRDPSKLSHRMTPHFVRASPARRQDPDKTELPYFVAAASNSLPMIPHSKSWATALQRVQHIGLKYSFSFLPWEDRLTFTFREQRKAVVCAARMAGEGQLPVLSKARHHFKPATRHQDAGHCSLETGTADQ